MSVRRRKVLVVEDDQRMADALALLLRAREIDEIFSSTGRDAEARAQRQSFDVVLVDLGLPDVDGVDIIARLRTLAPEMPALVITVLSAEEHLLTALRAGACGYLYKEDLGTRLIGAIDEVLEQAQRLLEDRGRHRGQPAGRAPAPAALIALRGHLASLGGPRCTPSARLDARGSWGSMGAQEFRRHVSGIP